MRSLKVFSAALFALIALNGAGFSGSSDLVGQWIVRWQNNPQNENAMSLLLREGRVSGTYTNDSKATRTVTGNISKQTRELALTIVCPKWDIRMRGSTSTGWKNVSGDYQPYVNSQGTFAMRKK